MTRRDQPDKRKQAIAERFMGSPQGMVIHVDGTVFVSGGGTRESEEALIRATHVYAETGDDSLLVELGVLDPAPDSTP